MSKNYMHFLHLVNDCVFETVGNTKTIINNVNIFNKKQTDPSKRIESLYCGEYIYKGEQVGYTYTFTLPPTKTPLKGVRLRARDIKRQTINLANSVWDSPYNIPLEDF